MATGIAATAAPRFRMFDTATVQPHEGFELWSSLFPFTDMAPLRRAPYRSSALTYEGADGSLLARVRMDATLSDFPEARSDRVMLNLFLDGRSTVRHGGHEDVVDAGSGFNLMDCAMPMRTLAGQHEGIHLLLPRDRVTALLGQRPAGDGRALRHLPETPLGHILKAHLRTVTQYGLALDAPSAGHAMGSLTTLALAYLSQFAEARDAPHHDAWLFDGACRYIETHLDTPQLSVASVARALGCSRTRLYRVFSEHDLSVASHARNLRLARSRTMLRDTRMSVGDVALACGYGDLPAFDKAFKRRFGMTPRQWRNEAGHARSGTDPAGQALRGTGEPPGGDDDRR